MSQLHSQLSVEFELARQRVDLWAVTKVLEHCPKYKKALWDLLDDEDREALKLYALARKGEQPGAK